MNLGELIRAKEEDRLIILPCRIGDTVHGFGAKYGFTCNAPLCLNGGTMCHAMGGCYSMQFQVNQHQFDITMLDDFNKTIFLTEDKALDALNKYDK